MPSSTAKLLYGAALLDTGEKRVAIEKLIDAFVDGLFAGSIAAFDLSSTRLFAALAAIALSKGFAVATRDVRPFRDMGVEVINPWQQD
ncbi:type II toxin-antitoxin system VapC family toxin [Roseovarius arcticus]|uniref:type II toxin-antitoxin system VapC family toxin n=1 Tax=Roseovarius arcticus TaxID=2547404 RepID=UPI001110C401|nr:type II toxin-antitoxin system VapC family toxin [Roseovarius arcticus]